MRQIFQQLSAGYNFADKTVLDAGSGAQSLEYLVSQSPKKIYSVSIDPGEIENNKKLFSSQANIEYIQADLTKGFQLPEKVDTVFADYFFAGVEGFRPFETINALQVLKKNLKDGGNLIIVAWEPSSNTVSKELQANEGLSRRRDALKMWQGKPVYREMPAFYLEQLTKLSGFQLIKKELRPKQVNKDFFDRYIESLMKHSGDGEEGIKKAAADYVSELKKIIATINFPIEYGQDYFLILENL